MVRQIAADLFRVYEQRIEASTAGSGSNKIETEIGMLKIDDENHFVLWERTLKGYDGSKVFKGLSASVCISKMLELQAWRAPVEVYDISVNYDYMTENY